ncbi:MAG: LytTR family transcriptional regulator, partial [Acetatifactor sp.]|nr:LytTR family transcriptional regulator [Acetatifactor sp.]
PDYYVPMGDIVYLESAGRKIRLVTLRETHEFYGSLKDIIKNLSEDFLVIHKSYVVNHRHVLRYAYESVELYNGVVLAISQANRSRVRERLLREE